MSELAANLRGGQVSLAQAATRTFYLGEAFLMTAIVLAGFWPFYADLPGGSVARHPVLYVHGAVFTGWLVLLISQAALVYRRDLRSHRRLGTFGAWYAVLVLLLGVAVTIVAPVEHVRAGRWTLDAAAGFLVLPVGDLILFGGLFAAGIIHRRNPAVHKRLMLLASTALIFPGAARLGDPSLAAIAVLWFLPVLLAMGFDRLTLGRVHRVYYLGLAIMVLFFARIALIESELWLRLARPIVSSLV